MRTRWWRTFWLRSEDRESNSKPRCPNRSARLSAYRADYSMDAGERFGHQRKTGVDMTITGSCHCGKSAFRIDGVETNRLRVVFVITVV